VTTLFERISSKATVDNLVESFYRKVLTDERISRFFDDADMERQMVKQKAFLTMAFGGPNEYTGKDMRLGHAHLLELGLNDSHVDAVIELLGKTLREHEVAESDIAQVAGIAESVRNDVLSR
jgi:hemoglobin